MLHSSDGGVVDGVGAAKSLKVEMLILEEDLAVKDIVEKIKRFPGEIKVELGSGLHGWDSVQRFHHHSHPSVFPDGKC